MVYLYNDNVIQRSFYVDSNIDQVPVFGLWCTHFRESAPLIISILALVVLSGQSEAFFAIDRLYRSPESFLGFATTFYSVQASEGRRPNSV